MVARTPPKKRRVTKKDVEDVNLDTGELEFQSANETRKKVGVTSTAEAKKNRDLSRQLLRLANKYTFNKLLLAQQDKTLRMSIKQTDRTNRLLQRTMLKLKSGGSISRGEAKGMANCCDHSDVVDAIETSASRIVKAIAQMGKMGLLSKKQLDSMSKKVAKRYAPSQTPSAPEELGPPSQSSGPARADSYESLLALPTAKRMQAMKNSKIFKTSAVRIKPKRQKYVNVPAHIQRMSLQNQAPYTSFVGRMKRAGSENPMLEKITKYLNENRVIGTGQVKALNGMVHELEKYDTHTNNPKVQDSLLTIAENTKKQLGFFKLFGGYKSEDNINAERRRLAKPRGKATAASPNGGGGLLSSMLGGAAGGLFQGGKFVVTEVAAGFGLILSPLKWLASLVVNPVFKGLGTLFKSGKFLLRGAVAMFAAVIAVVDFFSGFTNASEITGKEENSLTEKIGAGVAKAIDGITFGLLDAKDVFNFMKGGIEDISKGSEELLEYIDRIDFGGMWDGIKAGFSDTVGWIRSAFAPGGCFSGIRTIAGALVDAGKWLFGSKLPEFFSRFSTEWKIMVGRLKNSFGEGGGLSLALKNMFGPEGLVTWLGTIAVEIGKLALDVLMDGAIIAIRFLGSLFGKDGVFQTLWDLGKDILTGNWGSSLWDNWRKFCNALANAFSTLFDTDIINKYMWKVLDVLPDGAGDSAKKSLGLTNPNVDKYENRAQASKIGESANLMSGSGNWDAKYVQGLEQAANSRFDEVNKNLPPGQKMSEDDRAKYIDLAVRPTANIDKTKTGQNARPRTAMSPAMPDMGRMFSQADRMFTDKMTPKEFASKLSKTKDLPGANDGFTYKKKKLIEVGAASLTAAQQEQAMSGSDSSTSSAAAGNIAKLKTYAKEKKDEVVDAGVATLVNLLVKISTTAHDEAFKNAAKDNVTELISAVQGMASNMLSGATAVAKSVSQSVKAASVATAIDTAVK